MNKRLRMIPYLFLIPSLLGVSIFFLVPYLDVCRRSFLDAGGALSGLTKVETVRQSGEVTIPAERLYEETGQEPYVQAVITEASILGEQYVVENILVKVVSCEGGQAVLQMDEYVHEVIIDSEKAVEAGEKVRKE